MRTKVKVAVAGVLLCALPATAGLSTATAQGDTTAVAVNTRDGASIFRLAFQIRRVADGTVDQGNAAAAIASCIDCQTVALAFQVVLALGDTDTVTPENLAIALNTECSYCVTYAAATQLVLGFSGPVHFTDDGNQRLAELRRRLLELAADDSLTIEELNAAVDAARVELADILATEVVEVTAPADTAPDVTTTTASPTSTTMTTEPPSSTTTSTTSSPSTTEPPSSTTTSTTTSTSTTP